MKGLSQLSFAAEVRTDATEREIANHLVLQTALVAPVMLAVGAIFWGLDGVASAGWALVLVAVNFFLGAAVITWGASIGPTALFAAVMIGFVARLGIITGAVLPVRNTEWFETVPFAIALLVTHLGLLVIETRRFSMSAQPPDEIHTYPMDPAERCT